MFGFHSRRCRLVLLATCTQLGLAIPASAQELIVARYSTLRTTPTAEQINLLSAMVTERFPASIDTVGKAIHHLLRDSGYRLADQQAADPARAGLLALPLPAPHRKLGPMSVQTALDTLAGPAFRLVEDPVHRLISFDRCDRPALEVGTYPMRATTR